MRRPRTDRLLVIVGSLSLALALLALVLSLVDPRSLGGVSIWLKPGKFGLSIGLYLWTIALILPVLHGRRIRAAVRWLATVSMLAELITIYAQAARGVASHFNITTTTDAAIFAVMGVGIGLNIVANLIAAGTSLRPSRLPLPILWGIRLGFFVLLLGTLEGIVMIARQNHTVGALDGGPGLPLVNWSASAGDLRVAHFIGMHGFQAIPLLGWLLRAAPPARGVSAVVALTLVFFAVTTYALLGALGGRPFV